MEGTVWGENKYPVDVDKAKYVHYLMVLRSLKVLIAFWSQLHHLEHLLESQSIVKEG